MPRKEGVPNSNRFQAAESLPLPAKLLLKLKFGYEDSFRNSFGSIDETESYLESIVPHLQAHFCLESLGSKVQIEVLIRYQIDQFFINAFLALEG